VVEDGAEVVEVATIGLLIAEEVEATEDAEAIVIKEFSVNSEVADNVTDAKVDENSCGLEVGVAVPAVIVLVVNTVTTGFAARVPEVIVLV
jgi:hypothetical protein